MPPFDPTVLFADPSEIIEKIAVRDLVAWREHEGPGRLLVPPIQRSLVWRHAQILRYWDSLLRGYPPGTIQVHRVLRGDAAGIDATGSMQSAGAEDWQLFDGQQRLTTLALGHGRGIWSDIRTIWIDLGAPADRRHRDDNDDGTLFSLRLTTPSQPFGFDKNRPEDKLKHARQRRSWDEVVEKYGDESKDWTPAQVYALHDGSLIAEAVRPVRLAYLIASIEKVGVDQTVDEYSTGLEDGTVHDIVQALDRALKAKMIVQLIADHLIKGQGDYERFFERVGRGGTALSEPELIYSRLKHRHPALHDTMRAVMEGDAKRLAGEVDLIMASVRVARALELGGAGTTRPRPRSMYGDGWKPVETRFLGMVGDLGKPGTLPEALAAVRAALEYSPTNTDGLPAMLLARLPKHLLDVLLLMSYRGEGHASWTDEGKRALVSFALHWLLFVHDGEKASDKVFQAVVAQDWTFSAASIGSLMRMLDAEREAARLLPRSDDVEKMRAAIVDPAASKNLRRWHERFTAADAVDGPQPGDALRRLSTDRELIVRALTWLQRDYIVGLKGGYDPTAGSDDDLPVDLDHLIPASYFDDDWRVRSKTLGDDVDRQSFRDGRWVVGNSLGNFRWLASRQNRERQNGPIVVEEDMGRYLIEDVVPWNGIVDARVRKEAWTADQVAEWQRLVEMRVLVAYAKIFGKFAHCVTP